MARRGRNSVVESLLPKQVVVGSNPIARSNPTADLSPRPPAACRSTVMSVRNYERRDPVGKRRTIEVPGLSHGGTPIPTAVMMGNTLFTPAVLGTDTTTGDVAEPERQTALAFENMRRVVEEAGGTVDDIASVRVYMTDYALRGEVNTEWLKDVSRPRRPAHASRGPDAHVRQHGDPTGDDRRYRLARRHAG